MTLVLLTPIGLDAACWDAVRLPPGRVVRHEYPGFGGRPRAPVAPTMATLADELAERLPGPLDVVGVSMGGMVGQNLAVRHPDRVRSLLTACTGPNADPEIMARRAAAAEETGMAGVLDTTLERWFTASARGVPDHPGVEYARRTLLALDPGAFADGWRAIATHDVRDRLPGVRARVTVVAGADDAASPVARAQEVADRVPGARMVVLAGPHMINLEEPAALSGAIAEHLDWVQREAA